MSREDRKKKRSNIRTEQHAEHQPNKLKPSCQNESTHGKKGRITKIEAQKHHGQRYNIYIDGIFAFGIHEDVLISQRLLKGKEMDVDEWKRILKAEEKKKAEHAGLRYLSYRPRTVLEMERYLQSKDFAPFIVQEVIEQFCEQHYLDDAMFARQWVQERLRTKRKGPFLLQEELRQKGIADEWIHEALSQIEQDEQWQICLQLASKKWKSISSTESEEWKKKQKLFAYLQRRGFSYEFIQSVICHLEES